jgi:elongation factor 1-alpha
MDDFVSAKKPHLNLIIIGHVDHGKSTMTGHLLFATGNIDEKTIKKYADESNKLGVGETFKFAWVLDTLKEERERGVTIDLRYSSQSSTPPGIETSSRT